MASRSRTPSRTRTPGRNGRTQSQRNAVEGPVDPVEVFCRLRPLPQDAQECDACARTDDDYTVTIYPPENWAPSRQLQQPKESTNTFTRVFASWCEQTDVFDRVAVDLVEDLVKGKNGLLFTYGITGSGKTFTMTGNPRDPGILPRCLDVLFNSIGDYQADPDTFLPDGQNGYEVAAGYENDLDGGLVARQRAKLEQKGVYGSKAPMTPGRRPLGSVNSQEDDWEFRPRNTEKAKAFNTAYGMLHRERRKVAALDEDSVYELRVTYVEIYNNYIYDLLDPNAANGKLSSKSLREDMSHQMFVAGATERAVRSTEEAFDAFVQGQKLRRVAHTQLNMESSRSHSVFTMRLVRAPLDSSGRRVVNDNSMIHLSQLCLVDLAGSERSYRTKHQGERMKETGHINQSLMCLRQCIDTLRENQTGAGDRIVPYRDSRLTHMFKNYFDGEGKVRMIVCVNPMAGDYEENLHVMQFAEATQEVVIQRAQEVNFADLQGFTPGRRKNAILEEEIAAELNLCAPAVEAVRPAETGGCRDSFFEAMPNITLNGPADEDMLCRLRRHFENKAAHRLELMQRYNEKETEFGTHLREYVMRSEVNQRLVDENENEVKKLQTDVSRLMSENKQLRHKQSTLVTRLSRYENDAQSRLDKEEIHRKKTEELRAHAMASAVKLKAVRDVFERGSPMVTAGGGLSPSVRFGGSSEALATAKKQGPPAPPKTPATAQRALYPRITSTKTPGTSSQQQPTFNRRYHRRSRSTGMIIDHQPQHKVPAGEVMSPTMSGRKRTTRQPGARDLKAGTDYVLTHQEQDPTTGALRTSLVRAMLKSPSDSDITKTVDSTERQGEIIPTAGGGSAVCFNDVETLTHDTPGEKRRSDADSQERAKRSKR